MEQVNLREDLRLSRTIIEARGGGRMAREWKLDQIQDLKSRDLAVNNHIK